MSRRSSAVALTLACTLLLGACGSGANGGSDRTAVASFYPLAWATEQVAGDGWDVVNLTKPGTDPHDAALDIAQTAAISEADVVVLERGLQPAVDHGVDENAGDAATVDAAEAVELRAAEDEHDEDGHGDEQGDEAGHSSDDGHDHEGLEGLDPHFWLDPLLMADLADEVARTLGEVDPDGREGYAARAADLRTELEALDGTYADRLAACERTTVVVSHDAFGYLERYGLHFEPIAGLSPGAEATPADLARLQDLAREEGLTTVFSERLASTKMADALAADLGLDTAVLDPLEGLGDETADEDYLSLMRANLDALVLANGCR